jgi:acyl dehydratase
MPIDPQKLLNWTFPEIEHTYTDKDTMLYALGAGCAGDPLAEPDDLKFVYERNLVALPTMAVVIAYPGFWLGDKKTGVNAAKVLHGEQSLVLHKPLPATGTIVGKGRVTDLLDKGADKGAVMYSERMLFDKATGDKVATMSQTTMLRGDGGFGGKSGPQPEPHVLPEGAPDTHVDIKTASNAALIYRLCGDRNPLHADPEIAAKGGFKAPILHGLCTYAVAGRAILRACCGNDPARLKSLKVRFSSPVYPGETIRTEIWRGQGQASFRARVLERDVVVLNNGFAEIS